MKSFVIFIVIFCISATTEGVDECKLQLPAGCVKCTKEYSPGEYKPIKSFRGIKYATAKRFEDPMPLPPNPHPDIVINGPDHPICIQANSSFANYSSTDISEDCLFVNVFVPTDCGDGPLPVVVYIHGGTFEGGSGPTDPSNFLNKGVIVVTFNYRLSVFGFLSTGTCGCSGNAGLKDCLAALQWIKANIAYFGGNPEAVTIYGLSAGAAIATYLQLHPLACGLFHRIIIESGTSTSPWAFISLAKAVENAIRIGEKVGCNFTSPGKLCNCLKQVETMLLWEKGRELITAADLMTFSVVAFAPTAENPKCLNTFITENPQNIILKGLVCAVKMIIGVTQEEACIFKKQLQENKNVLIPLTAVAYKVAPKCLAETSNVLCGAYITKEMINHYVGYDIVLNANNTLKLISTVQFILPIVIYAKLMTQLGCEVFLYEFAYVGPCSIAKLMDPEQSLSCHAEQYPYLFPSPLIQYCNFMRPNVNDPIISSIMTTLYSNFITSGCPTPGGSGLINWPAWTCKKQAYLKVDVQLKIEHGLRKKEISFWKNQLDKCFSDVFGIINNPTCCTGCSKEISPCVL